MYDERRAALEALAALGVLVGSFSREAVLSHGRRIPDIERLLVTTEVPCLTFASLCETHGVEEVDLLPRDLGSPLL